MKVKKQTNKKHKNKPHNKTKINANKHTQEQCIRPFMLSAVTQQCLWRQEALSEATTDSKEADQSHL